MAEWGMATLVFHFTDDHGCAVRLPAFERLALPNTFSAEKAKELVEFAARRGIEVIPELEAFGHTRCLTGRPEHAHLYAGTTVWCPYRYYQDSLWPAISFSAEAPRRGSGFQGYCRFPRGTEERNHLMLVLKAII